MENFLNIKEIENLYKSSVEEGKHKRRNELLDVADGILDKALKKLVKIAIEIGDRMVVLCRCFVLMFNEFNLSLAEPNPVEIHISSRKVRNFMDRSKNYKRLS
jgi:hypothetical protein